MLNSKDIKNMFHVEQIKKLLIFQIYFINIFSERNKKSIPITQIMQPAKLPTTIAIKDFLGSRFLDMYLSVTAAQTPPV